MAEPQEHRLKKIKDKYGIPDKHSFRDWKEFVNIGEKIADAAIITTQDRMHKDPAVALAKMGYHILLEKPMAVEEGDCEEIVKACEDAGVILAVCHMMRYAPVCAKIKEIVDSGAIGEVTVINHSENILYWHFAHSYVRGNWKDSSTSTFSLLAKCCHDIDLIAYWMGDAKCEKIQSFGNLQHFKRSQKPVGAAERCFDCSVERDCPYSAKKIYLESSAGVPHWPMSTVCDIEDHPAGYKTALKEALETGPYGKCVYESDNDVCDHQVHDVHIGLDL